MKIIMMQLIKVQLDYLDKNMEIKLEQLSMEIHMNCVGEPMLEIQ